MKTKIFYPIGILLIILWVTHGCTKDEFTLPASFQINLQLVKDTSGYNFISFTKGTVTLKKLEFEGYRETAEDYFFEKNFQPALSIQVTHSNSTDSLLFDVPQGIYKRIYVTIEFLAEEVEAEGNLISDNSESLENKGGEVENPESFRFEGVYDSPSRGLLPVLIIGDDIKFGANARARNGQNEIVINKETGAEANLFFNPENAVGSMGITSIEDTETSLIDGVPTLVFSEDSNETLYEIILFRLQQKFSMVVN